jgi:hypothetical protein
LVLKKVSQEGQVVALEKKGKSRDQSLTVEVFSLLAQGCRDLLSNPTF